MSHGSTKDRDGGPATKDKVEVNDYNQRAIPRYPTHRLPARGSGSRRAPAQRRPLRRSHHGCSAPSSSRSMWPASKISRRDRARR